MSGDEIGRPHVAYGPALNQAIHASAVFAESVATGLTARIAALEAERDAARAEAGRLRGAMERTLSELRPWYEPGGEPVLYIRTIAERLSAALAGCGEQQP